MNTDSSYIQELKAYGYSEVEAGFLRLVALHSGVFLARQFNQFAQTKSGKRVDSLVNKRKPAEAWMDQHRTMIENARRSHAELLIMIAPPIQKLVEAAGHL